MTTYNQPQAIEEFKKLLKKPNTSTKIIEKFLKQCQII